MQPALRGSGSPHKKETACLILVSVCFLLSDDSKNRPCQNRDNSDVLLYKAAGDTDGIRQLNGFSRF